MKEDKAFIVRKVLTVVSLILIFATAGLLAITTQLKTITFNYYGNVKSIKTLASSVDAFLLQNDICLNESAIIEPAKKSRLTNGMTITVSSKETESFDIESVRESYSPVVASVSEEIESIPYEEEKVNNDERESGETAVLKEGVEGSKSISYIVKSTNDKVIQKDEIRSKVLAEAQNRVVEVGTKVTVSRSNVVTSIMTDVVDGGFVQYNISLPVEYQQYAYNLCKRYGIDYPLFLAMMYQESTFNVNAGANGLYKGLCQVGVGNLPIAGIETAAQLLDPYNNMAAGAYMLYNNLVAARNYTSDTQTQWVFELNSYNMGIGGYLSVFNSGTIDRAYSTNILRIRDRLITNGGL